MTAQWGNNQRRCDRFCAHAATRAAPHPHGPCLAARLCVRPQAQQGKMSEDPFGWARASRQRMITQVNYPCPTDDCVAGSAGITSEAAPRARNPPVPLHMRVPPRLRADSDPQLKMQTSRVAQRRASQQPGDSTGHPGRPAQPCHLGQCGPAVMGQTRDTTTDRKRQGRSGGRLGPLGLPRSSPIVPPDGAERRDEEARL